MRIKVKSFITFIFYIFTQQALAGLVIEEITDTEQLVETYPLYKQRNLITPVNIFY